nr:unnamed protein product [Callosobruchus analis]
MVVGLVQLTPHAADADHRYLFIGAGAVLLVVGLITTMVRCFCMHCPRGGASVVGVLETGTGAVTDGVAGVAPLDAVASVDGLVQRRDTQVGGRIYLHTNYIQTNEPNY